MKQWVDVPPKFSERFQSRTESNIVGGLDFEGFDGVVQAKAQRGIKRSREGLQLLELDRNDPDALTGKSIVSVCPLIHQVRRERQGINPQSKDCENSGRPKLDGRERRRKNASFPQARSKREKG